MYSSSIEYSAPFLHPHVLFQMADGVTRIMQRDAVESIKVHQREGWLLLVINGAELGRITDTERKRIIQDLTGFEVTKK